MKIKNIEGLTAQQLQREVESGGKFVCYQFTVSVIVLTFKQSSDIYFVRPGEQAWIKGLPFTVITLLFGWWGIPWGPIYTVGSLYRNLSGGKDVTHEVLAGGQAA